MEDFLSSLKTRPSHAYLITGPLAARQRAAKEAADILLCQSEAPPCGVCQGCRLTADGSNTDLVTVSFDPGKKSIGVDSVRSLISMLSTAPNRHRRVVIIEPAHAMTRQTQNALLKTLEEPPGNAALLLCGDESGLLPTIRSRCVPVRLGNAAPQEDEYYQKALALCRDLLMPGFDPKRLSGLKSDMGEVLERLAAIYLDEHRRGLGVAGVLSGGAGTEKCQNKAALIMLQGAKRLKSNASPALTAQWIILEMDAR